MAQWSAFSAQRPLFQQVGFRLEEFGGQTVMLRAIPALVKNREPRALLVEVLDELIEGDVPLLRTQIPSPMALPPSKKPPRCSLLMYGPHASASACASSCIKKMYSDMPLSSCTFL